MCFILQELCLYIVILSHHCDSAKNRVRYDNWVITWQRARLLFASTDQRFFFFFFCDD
jgi:hypothetical protein